jgi:type II secretory pathway pseudopilin PulG
MNKKKGQMQIGFGMIFSIVLIIIFIAFAIYAISKFLGIQRFAQVEKFKNDFQEDIEKMWKSSASQGAPVEYFIPKKIEQVCFFPDRKNELTGKMENMYFVPDDFSNYSLEYVDMIKTVAGSRTVPKTLCISPVGGKISMTIKKNWNENLVTITK